MGEKGNIHFIGGKNKAYKTCCTLAVQRAEVLDYLVCGSSYPVEHAVLTDNKLPQKQFIKSTMEAIKSKSFVLGPRRGQYYDVNDIIKSAGTIKQHASGSSGRLFF